MKLLLTKLVFLSFWIALCGQTPKTAFDPKQRLAQHAASMGKAFLDKDYSTFTRYVYPNLTKLMGGSSNMIAVLKKGIGEMTTQGITFTAVRAVEPGKIIKVNRALQCLVPQQIEMKLPKGRIAQNFSLIAIPNDEGAS